MMIEDNKFKFWFPIEKAQETSIDPTTGEKVMRLGGIASTSDEDSDGEFLDPKGFDIKPLIESGMVNWHHQAKDQPATIIGEPTKAEIRPNGLYIETELYPSSKIACDVWELAGTLEKDSKTRRLGYSIEGKVVKRKSEDKKSPDYKKIDKAIITGVAITHQPKNPKTFANIIKGEINDELDEDEEKSLDTENGKPLKKESLGKNLKNQNLSKSEILEILFKTIPGISIEKAKNIHLMLKKFVNMKGETSITNEDIKKAYEALGLNVNDDYVKKGEDFNDKIVKTNKKPIDKKKSKTKDVKVSDEYDTDEYDEDDTDENENQDVKKGVVNRFDRIEKAIASSHANQINFIKAIAVMVKDVSQKATSIMSENSELKEIVKGQEDVISIMSEKLEAFGSNVPAPKSISSARVVERNFSKGDNDEFSNAKEKSANKNQISIKNTTVVAELLDQATFNKGFDEEFSKACTSFEANKTLSTSIISRMKNEYGIEIVN